MKTVMMLLFVLFAVLPTYAQMSTQDTYQSVTTDGTYLYTSVTLEGHMFSNISINAIHTYTNASVLNGVLMQKATQTHQGQYASLTNQQSLTLTQGVQYEYDTEESVNCTYMGDFFDTSNTSYVEYAFEVTQEQVSAKYNCTFGINDTGAWEACTIPQITWCNNTPDLNVTVIHEEAHGIPYIFPDYADNNALCFSASGHQPYHCTFAISFPVYTGGGAIPKENCTSHP